MTRAEIQRHLRAGRPGIAIWNEWRTKQLEAQAVQGAGSPQCLSEVYLPGLDLRGADLRGALLLRANLLDARFDGGNIAGVALSASNLNGASFANANLTEASMSSCLCVETSFVGADLSKAKMSTCQFIGADMSRVILDETDLHGSVLVDVCLQNATIKNCSIYGSSIWNCDLLGAVQEGIRITLESRGEPTITVDNLEIAQFIYLLVRHKSIRDVIDTVTSKIVLILGRFTDEHKPTLDAIRANLRNHDCCPVMFDFDRPRSRDTGETVSLLGGLARFIIADVSDARSVPQELQIITDRFLSVPVQPILQKGQRVWGMFDGIARKQAVLPVLEYEGLDELRAALPEIIKNANNRAIQVAAAHQ